jgi:pSer/pThr/pTyr-binding forkhead associated (FHA) protein
MSLWLAVALGIVAMLTWAHITSKRDEKRERAAREDHGERAAREDHARRRLAHVKSVPLPPELLTPRPRPLTVQQDFSALRSWVLNAPSTTVPAWKTELLQNGAVVRGVILSVDNDNSPDNGLQADDVTFAFFDATGAPAFGRISGVAWFGGRAPLWCRVGHPIAVLIDEKTGAIDVYENLVVDAGREPPPPASAPAPPAPVAVPSPHERAAPPRDVAQPHSRAALVLRVVHDGSYFVVSPGDDVIVGCTPETAGLIVRAEGVARRHARFVHDGHKLVVEDQGSQHGTLVNDVPVQRARLVHGDRVLVGAAEIQVERPADEPAAATAPHAAPPVKAAMERRDVMLMSTGLSGPNHAPLGGASLVLRVVEDGRRFVVSPGDDVTLGRSAEAATLVVDVRGVARRHARFTHDGDTLIVEDLETAPGTFLNGIRVQRAAVSPGDTLHIGTARLVVERASSTRTVE